MDKFYMDQFYINQLNLQALGLKGGPVMWFTDHFTTPSGKLIRGELRFHQPYNDETYGARKVSISHTSTAGWTKINGDSAEQRLRILQYLATIGFKPALTLLREYKIDNLLA